MKLGLLPPYRTGAVGDPSWVADFAAHAEEAGFESLYVVEHVVVAAGYTTRYPYSDTGRMPLPDDTAIPDPLELLAWLAARTERVRLATGILVLPAHHPVALAKRLATLDRLAGGRVTLGVGAGWMREELEAVGVDFASRGRRMDESIDVLRALWAGGEVSHHGELFSFERVRSEPGPVQPGGPPIHVGGHSPAAARRAGTRGDGFQPLGVAGDVLAERWDTVRRTAEAAGRDPERIELSLGGLLDDLDAERLAAARAAGAHRLVLSTRTADLAALRAAMDRAVALAA